MKGAKPAHAVLLISIVLLFIACSGMVQKGGEILEGSSGGEMELALYRSDGKDRETIYELRELVQKDGKIILEISSGMWPGLALRGSKPDGRGNFELTGVRILSPHVNGWNEFTLDILGKAIFDDPKKSGATLYITGDLERVQISSGKIRLKSKIGRAHV